MAGDPRVVESLEGSASSVLHETSSRFLFAVGRRGGRIDSARETVTLPLSEIAAVVEEFVDDRRAAVRAAVRVAFAECRTNHEAAAARERTAAEETLRRRTRETEERARAAAEADHAARRASDDDARRREHYHMVKDLLNRHRRQTDALRKMLEDERKGHDRRLAAVQRAQRDALQRLQRETFG